MRISLIVVAGLIGAASVAATAAEPMTDKLPSGVLVQHVKAGNGPMPKASDAVKVHYRGSLENGKEFDSSYARGEPISFPLGRVITCWTQGVQKLKVGGKAKLTCPGDTAYGSRGIPGVIPPNSTILFDVELIAIE